MTDTTPRLTLPLLAAGQAQKEVFHNEALATLDALVQGSAESAGTNDPPAAPAAGQSWIVGATPSGAWDGRSQSLATWTAGGWRFTAPVEGMTIRVADQNLFAGYRSGIWRIGEVDAANLRIGGRQVVGPQQSAISEPSGGTTIDMEARAALTAVLVTLRTHGLIAV